MKPNIFDANGTLIKKGSIAGMSDPNGFWENYQGVVIEPNSTVEESGYCVALFFDKEVPTHMFLNRRQMVACTATELCDNCPRKMPGKCFRIIFFLPNELVVKRCWDIEHLASRLFGRNYHTLYEKEMEFVEGKPCQIKDCEGTTNNITLINIWGSVHPIYACAKCFQKYNGARMDILPECK